MREKYTRLQKSSPESLAVHGAQHRVLHEAACAIEKFMIRSSPEGIHELCCDGKS